MHSDQNYFVDQSLFGSSSSRNPSLNNSSNRNQLIVRSDDANLQKKIQLLLATIEICDWHNKISFVNMTDACVLKFQHSHECETVMIKLKKIIQQSDQRMTVDWYEPKDERNVYVRNLPLEFSENELRNLFQSYGAIISVKLIRKEINNNCIGFIRYQSKSEAEKAIREVNNLHMNLMGTDRMVRCESSKVNHPFASTSAPHGDTRNVGSIQHQNLQTIYRPNDPNNNFNLINANQYSFIPSASDNSMFMQPIQMPPLYGNVVPIPVVYGLSQQQFIQQDYNPIPVVYLPLNQYNAQNN